VRTGKTREKRILQPCSTRRCCSPRKSPHVQGLALGLRRLRFRKYAPCTRSRT